MKCKICSSEMELAFRQRIMGRHEIAYYQCPECGFMQTETPYWLPEAYSEPINASDTGYVQRNNFLAHKMTVLLYHAFNPRGAFLDYGAGHGMFVRLMRDAGFDFYWSDKYAKNIFARGFEQPAGKQFDAVTAFEAFEHFDDPLAEIEAMLRASNNIILTTCLLPSPRPDPAAWGYYAFDHGQHIAFYSAKTMNYIAQRYNLHYAGYRQIHFLTERPLSQWQIYAMKFTRLGYHKWIEQKMTSLTQADHIRMQAVMPEKND